MMKKFAKKLQNCRKNSKIMIKQSILRKEFQLSNSAHKSAPGHFILLRICKSSFFDLFHQFLLLYEI